MTVTEILTQLEALGTEKMRAFNAKNGAGANQFGVKMGDIRALAKKIKTNHELALELWATNIIEAQLLAILLLKPKLLSTDKLEQMVRSATFIQVADWLNSYVVKKHPYKEALRVAWLETDDPMSLRAGWSLTAERIARSPDGLALPAILDRIETELASAVPDVQWTMNHALAEIGIHHAAQRERAINIGESLGVYRDYPVSKGCTSPFAPIWINEMVSRQEN